ncbi:hypothetical protein [Allorhizobium ampelinum]|uniref:hypothetical protein n=1 Tax=Allorhizobium ampelinum TaxID=3025782 RepID=UPI001F33F09E|nr:hypothetical protein [Allorhizobium ampelinum]
MKKQPSAQQIKALQAFAAAHGRNWKHILSTDYWPKAQIWSDGPGGKNMGAILHGIRNEYGPSWLYNEFKLQAK